MLCGGVIILGRWGQAPRASVWAALGFGLVLVLCFVMPLAQTMIQQWVLEDGQRASRMWAFTAFGIVGSVLHAMIYALLLAAIYAGRGEKRGWITAARIEDGGWRIGNGSGGTRLL
jgi:hypothetical protein